jgi:hypothetical protein
MSKRQPIVLTERGHLVVDTLGALAAIATVGAIVTLLALIGV